MKKTSEFTRCKALALVISAGLLLALLIALRWQFGAKDDFMTTESRKMFLSNLGWEIDPETESCKNILLPRTLEGVLAEYNDMQLKQNLDLRPYLGAECQQYSYLVTNYPGCDEAVYLTLYIHQGKLIAADIHSNSVNGFMHGIYKDLNV